MTKSELINALRENDLTKNEATKVVQLFFDEMSNALANGGRVEIRGLCTFYVKKYKPYTGRNPKTGKHGLLAPQRLQCVLRTGHLAP